MLVSAQAFPSYVQETRTAAGSVPSPRIAAAKRALAVATEGAALVTRELAELGVTIVGEQQPLLQHESAPMAPGGGAGAPVAAAAAPDDSADAAADDDDDSLFGPEVGTSKSDPALTEEALLARLGALAASRADSQRGLPPVDPRVAANALELMCPPGMKAAVLDLIQKLKRVHDDRARATPGVARSVHPVCFVGAHPVLGLFCAMPDGIITSFGTPLDLSVARFLALWMAALFPVSLVPFAGPSGDPKKLCTTFKRIHAREGEIAMAIARATNEVVVFPVIDPSTLVMDALAVRNQKQLDKLPPNMLADIARTLEAMNAWYAEYPHLSLVALLKSTVLVRAAALQGVPSGTNWNAVSDCIDPVLVRGDGTWVTGEGVAAVAAGAKLRVDDTASTIIREYPHPSFVTDAVTDAAQSAQTVFDMAHFVVGAKNPQEHSFVRSLACLEDKTLAVKLVVMERRDAPSIYAEWLQLVRDGPSPALRALEAKLLAALASNTELLRALMRHMSGTCMRLIGDPIALEGILTRELLTRVAAGSAEAAKVVVRLPGAPAETEREVGFLMIVCGGGRP
jgi:hypothetical protein